MNIFVTNDDGIKAEGITNLVSALSEIADIYVGAPNEQKSASGHGITLGREITVEEVSFTNAKRALCIAGTPVDCVKIGLDIFQRDGIIIDKVFSGINMGGNLGTDTLYSGTVSAAVEGLLCGVPSVAVSVNSHAPKHYDVACELAVKAAKLDFSTIDENMVLNINAPNIAKEEVKGVVVTGLGVREYDSWYEEAACENGKRSFVYAGSPVYYEDLSCETNDVGASQEKYATITPLHYDLTNYDLIEKVKATELAELL